MSNDPYKSPDSDVGNNGNAQPPQPNALWRAFFGFNCLLIVLNILFVPFIEELGMMEVIDFTFTNLVFVGLCGFIFSKSIGNVVFWRYFFYAALIESFIVLILFPVFEIPLYGQPTSFDMWLVFNLVNTFFNLMALNLYAYKIRGLWPV